MDIRPLTPGLLAFLAARPCRLSLVHLKHLLCCHRLRVRLQGLVVGVPLQELVQNLLVLQCLFLVALELTDEVVDVGRLGGYALCALVEVYDVALDEGR